MFSFSILVKYFVDNFVRPLAGIIFSSLKDGIAVQISSPCGKKHIVGIKDEIFTEFKNSGYEDINDFFQIKLAELKEKQDSHFTAIKDEIFAKFKDSGYNDINDFLLASLNELEKSRPPSSPEEYKLDSLRESEKIGEYGITLQDFKQIFFKSGLSQLSAKKLYLEMQKSFDQQIELKLELRARQNKERQDEINRLLVKKFKENLSEGIKVLDHARKKYSEQVSSLSPEELVNFVYRLQEKQSEHKLPS